MTQVWQVMGYDLSPLAFRALNSRCGFTSMPSPAADAAAVVGSTNLPAWFLTLANFRPEALASDRSTKPMAPLVDFTIWATPPLPWPACVSEGHSTVEPLFSFHTPLAALFRYSVKFCVVPEPSARWATTMSSSGG